MHLFKSFETILKENDELKNAIVLFLCKKHNSVSSFCRSALKVILNDSPFNFVGTRQLSAESSKFLNYFIHIKLIYFLWRYSTCLPKMMFVWQCPSSNQMHFTRAKSGAG